MLTPQFKPPKKRLNPNMMAESADMAAEQMQMAPQPPQPKPAPVIPTTNMRMPTPQPMASGASTSGAPSGTAGGFMNVTGPGQRQDMAAEAERERQSRLSARASGDMSMGVNPEIIRNRAMQEITQEEKDSNQLYDEVLRELLGEGPRDTTAEEERIRRQMESDVSAGQAGLNARLAAGGGGTSGALGALSTDMRSRAALDAATGIEGVKENARDEYLRKLQLGMGGEMQDRAMDMDEAQFEMYMNMINQLFGNESDGSVPQARTPTQYEFDAAEEVSTQPQGSTLAFSGSGYNVYEKDGKYYKVRVRSMRPNTNV